MQDWGWGVIDSYSTVSDNGWQDWIPAKRSWQAIIWSCEHGAWVMMKPPWCWRYHSHGMSAKENWMQGVELVQERSVCCRQQSWRGGVTSFFWNWDNLPGVLDARHEVRSLAFSPLGFSHALAESYHAMSPFLSFVQLSFGSMQFVFLCFVLFYRWSQFRHCLESQKRLLKLD